MALLPSRQLQLDSFQSSFSSLQGSPLQCFSSSKFQNRSLNLVTRCHESKESSSEVRPRAKASQLEIGSPIVVVEAPTMIKTAASMPCLRVNAGLVKAGDVGRIVSRKPMDVWAVRLAIGTYLIDGKYFKPLELDE